MKTPFYDTVHGGGAWVYTHGLAGSFAFLLSLWFLIHFQFFLFKDFKYTFNFFLLKILLQQEGIQRKCFFLLFHYYSLWFWYSECLIVTVACLVVFVVCVCMMYLDGVFLWALYLCEHRNVAMARIWSQNNLKNQFPPPSILGSLSQWFCSIVYTDLGASGWFHHFYFSSCFQSAEVIYGCYCFYSFTWDGVWGSELQSPSL